MVTTTDIHERYLRHYICNVLATGSPDATKEQSPPISFVRPRTTKLCINWTSITRVSRQTLNKAWLLPLLVAVTFPEAGAEHLPHVMQCLKPHKEKFYLPTFPVTWGAAYDYANRLEQTEAEEMQWKQIDKAVAQFFIGWNNSRKFQQALIKRFESFVKDDLIDATALPPLRREGLLGIPGDRVSLLVEDAFAKRLGLSVGETSTWALDRSISTELAPAKTLGQEYLELLNGYVLGVYHVDNYVLFNIPLMAYDVLSTGRQWSMLPERAYAVTNFASTVEFGNHLATFRDELYVNFDRRLTEIKLEPKTRVAAKWVDTQLKTLQNRDDIRNALISLPSYPEKLDRLRIVNTIDFRKKTLGLLNRKYVRSAPEKRAERKELLDTERSVAISLPENVQKMCGFAGDVLTTCRHERFYVEARACLPFTERLQKHLAPRVKTNASHISVGATEFVSLEYLKECHIASEHDFDYVNWMPLLCEEVMNALAIKGLATVDEWKEAYAERLKRKTYVESNKQHTTFTLEDDIRLWGLWKRYMHAAARAEVLVHFDWMNPKHVILRGRLMSRIRRAKKPMEFLYDLEGLKKFLGDQFRVYSPVID